MNMTKIVWCIILSCLTGILGITDFTCDAERPLKGSNVTCMCSTQNNIEWQLNDVILSTCITSGVCSPKPVGYDFQTDISNADIEYHLTVQNFGYSSCTVYSCTDKTTLVEEKVTLGIADFNSTSPSVIDEPGPHKSGAIEITTECLFKESDIVVKWYKVKGDEQTEITPNGAYKRSTNCTDTCNGETAVKLNIGFEHIEDEDFTLERNVKFRLEVYHTADVTNKLVLETNGEYDLNGSLIWEIIVLAIILPALFISGIILGIGIYFGLSEKLCGVFGKGDKLNWYVIIPLCIIIVGLGIIIVWLILKLSCTGSGNGDVKPKEEKSRHETRSGNTHTGQKKPETKKNESKDSGAHIENEQHNQGKKHREQPLPPSGAGAATGTMHGREDSDGAVSRDDVDLQESGRTLPQRPMPDIPRKNERQGHDSKGRGLSANFNDDDHPLIGVNIPTQKAGALEALPEGTGGEGPVKKLKKKKKKSKDQEDEV